MKSVAIDKLDSLIGYADALKDLHLLPDDKYQRLLGDLWESHSLIIGAMEEYERLVKDK